MPKQKKPKKKNTATKQPLELDLFPAYAAIWHEAGHTVQKRFYILRHWQNFGITKTIEKFGISKSTLYRWRSRLTESGLAGISELSPQSTTPKNKRKPTEWPLEVVTEIVLLKIIYPNIGRHNMHYLIKRFCEPRQLPCPCPSSIARLLKTHVINTKQIKGPFINPSLLASYYRAADNIRNVD